MLQALIITLREGVEAALIIGITLAYISKIGLPSLRKSVFYGLTTAFLASIALAAAISKTNFNPEIFEGVVMLVAAFFVVTMVLFMARAAKTLKGDIEKKVGGFARRGSQWGLFLFVFLMVLREGVETVLILSAVSLNTSELMSFLGTLAGISLSVVFGVMFVKGSVRIDLRRFFKVTSIILFFVAAQLTISGLHELSENGLIPSTKRQMAIIGPIVRNDIFFFVTMLAFAAMMVLFEYRHRGAAPTTAGQSPAEMRKATWTARRERRWMASVYVSSFVFILMVTLQFIYAKSASALSPAVAVTFVDGKVTIPTGEMRDGELRRYSSLLRGHPVRFLIYKRPGGKIATIMDACLVCGPIGYYSNGSQGIICKNCNAPINPQSLGQEGGCNPIPLVAKIDAGSVTVTEMDLTTGASQIKE